jgi:hypothetical protein
MAGPKIKQKQICLGVFYLLLGSRTGKIGANRANSFLWAACQQGRDAGARALPAKVGAGSRRVWCGRGWAEEEEDEDARFIRRALCGHTRARGEPDGA